MIELRKRYHFEAEYQTAEAGHHPTYHRPSWIETDPPQSTALCARCGHDAEFLVRVDGSWLCAACSRPSEAGQGLAEYGLLLALIAVAAIIALMFLGGQVGAMLSTAGGHV